MLDATADAANRWIFPGTIQEGLGPWDGVRWLAVAGPLNRPMPSPLKPDWTAPLRPWRRTAPTWPRSAIPLPPGEQAATAFELLSRHPPG